MRLHTIVSRFALLIGLFSAASEPVLYAQSQSDAKIVGSVIDSETGEAIVGANVLLEGTTTGAATDLDGKFTISGVKPGTYTLVVSVISYARKRITDLLVEGGKTVLIDVVMRSETIQLDVVEISAKAETGYEGALLTKQKKAASISDGISAEQVKRTPDATSGDALRRVTGISVVDNKFIFVRGTPERYSNTMLNGASVSSTEPDKKAFSFDIIPSNLIDNTIITKSFTPDLPGDFAGGVVRMSTIDFPASPTLRVSHSTTYTTNTTFRGFSTYHGGTRDFLGLDDGTRRLPAGFPGSLGSAPYTTGEILDFARLLRNEWAPQEKKAPLNQNFMISFGDGTTIIGQNFGFITALTYKSSFDVSAIERNEYEASGEPRFLYSGGQSQYSVMLGGIANLSYKVSPFHKLSFRNTYSRTSDDEVTQFTGVQFTDIGAEQRHTAMRFVSRSVYSGQLLGEHYFPTLEGLQLEWSASTSTSFRDEPDYRRIVYFREAGTNDPFVASLGFQANLKNGGRFYSDLADRANGASLNVAIPVGTGKFKVGGQVDEKDRDFHSRLIGMIVNGRGNGFTESELYSLPLDQIFDPANFRRNGFSIDEYQNGSNNYHAFQNVFATYAMVDLPFSFFSQDLRFIGGMRYEKSVQRVNSMDLSGQNEVKTELANNTILPSLSLVYAFSENANFRLAYGQTLNRPELRELAPFAYFDFNTQTSIRGNENLRQSKIQNYDARLEFFPGVGELLSASLFYKSFRDAIEQVVVTGSALGSERTFVNADRATNYGLELEARLSLRHIGDALSHFSLMGNYSRIASVVNVDGTETTIEKRDRPLQGQSPYMVNLGLLYQHPDAGTSLSVLYNTFGERIVEVATAYEEDVIEQSRNALDVVLTQSVFTRYELKVTLKDLLHEEQIFRQGDKKARGNQKGTSYSVGIAVKL